MKSIAFIGWRGLVGSVLLERLQTQPIWQAVKWHFASTSQAGSLTTIAGKTHTLHDAYNIDWLQSMDVIITCQGSDYTKIVYPKLRAIGWQGYFLDAASHLRYQTDSILVLDPINHKQIQQGMDSGIKTYVGANCTVSLLLLAIAGLLRENLVENIITSSYQALSGAGAEALLQLGKQLTEVGSYIQQLPDGLSTLQWLAKLTENQQTAAKPRFANNVIPWISHLQQNGQTQEEWKAAAEANKILGLAQPIEIDGLCARVDALRCHSQFATIQLTRDISVTECETLIATAHPWVTLIPNQQTDTVESLNPVAFANTLQIGVGRVRKLNVGSNKLALFTTGDQLLWGAAEPLLRVLNIILGYRNENH